MRNSNEELMDHLSIGRNSSNSKGQGLLLDIGRVYFTASGTLVLWDYTKEYVARST